MAEPLVAPVVHGQRLEIRPGRFLNVTHRPVTEAATTLFFAHGGGGNQDQWRFLWQDPRLAGYNLVAWDLLGHGVSDKPKAASAYAWDELVADQLAIYQRFESAQNILVAHSFGTALTLSTVTRLREQNRHNHVAAVLLLGTQLQSPKGRSPLLKLPAWILEWLRPLLAKGFRDAAWHPDTDRALLAYEETLTERNKLYVFKALLSQTHWIPEDQLAQLNVPVLILSGEADRLTPPEGGRALQQKIPGAAFEIVKGTAHQLQLEQPELVLGHLLALVARVQVEQQGAAAAV